MKPRKARPYENHTNNRKYRKCSDDPSSKSTCISQNSNEYVDNNVFIRKFAGDLIRMCDYPNNL